MGASRLASKIHGVKQLYTYNTIGPPPCLVSRLAPWRADGLVDGDVVTGLITERGVIPPTRDALAKAFDERAKAASRP